MKLIRRGILPVAAAAIAAVLLSACGGPGAASSAAVIGEQSVANTTLVTFVADLHVAQQMPVDEADLETTQGALHRLILESLVHQSAQRLGITVTEAEIESRIAKAEESLGGRDALNAALLQSQIPPSGITGAFRLAAELDAMGPILVPGTDTNAQDLAKYEYIVALANEVGVTVNPRYGTWNAKDLAVGPLPTDLAVPASK